MNAFFIFIPILLYIGIIAAFVYVLYRMIDGWVNKSLTVRREQNTLLAKLVETLNANTDINNPDKNQS